MRALGLLAALLAAAPAAAAAKPQLAVVSYWGRHLDDFYRLPDHSLALINPNSGVLATGDAQKTADGLEAYQPVLRYGRRHHLRLYGYVPTGYFRHDCNEEGKCQTWGRIEAQVKTYFQRMPELEGVFFDETSPAAYSCASFTAEYRKLREIVARYRPHGRVIFNPGTPDPCAIQAAAPGETVVLFEDDGQNYLKNADKIAAATRLADQRGVRTWHIVNHVAPAQLKGVLHAADVYGPDYFYAVDVSGDWRAGFDTYGGLPPYWQAEVDALGAREENKP